MAAFNWRRFFRDWNDELLESRRLADRLWYRWDEDLAEAAAARWLGYPAASEEEITRAEARLGTTLPPSYRAFLQASNGWRYLGTFVPELWPSWKIDWLTNKHRERVDAWLEGERYHGEPIRIPDERYFVYGKEQDPVTLRSEYLETALAIGPDEMGNGMYLLNPRIVTPEGEWEAWFWAAWLPGAKRYRSFQEMMVAERESFRRSEGLPP